MHHFGLREEGLVVQVEVGVEIWIDVQDIEQYNDFNANKTITDCDKHANIHKV